MDLRLIVHKSKSIYDDLVINTNWVANYEENEEDFQYSRQFKDAQSRTRMNKRGFNAYVASAYVYLLKTSEVYRKSAARALYCLVQSSIDDNKNPVIFMRLRTPRKQFLDYNWGERMTHMAREKREIDYAMSWLSTLGGAFSAMGDHFTHCAQIAGKISLHQFKLALRLGDPLLVARCKLYAALSLIQQNKLKIPKLIIPEIHAYAVRNKDKQLRKMCLGIWAKLKYQNSLMKQSRRGLAR